MAPDSGNSYATLEYNSYGACSMHNFNVVKSLSTVPYGLTFDRKANG